MDLSSIFGLNSHFGAVWERFALFRIGSLTFAKQPGLSKSTGPLLLELSARQRSGFAGYFPIIFRSVAIVALAELRVCESGHWMM
jgi:hypothetical protein